MDETQLIRAADSNVEAFIELYRRHITRVYRYHMAYIGNAQDAAPKGNRSGIIDPIEIDGVAVFHAEFATAAEIDRAGARHCSVGTHK